MKSGLCGSIPSSLRHSRALCQAGKPLQKQPGGKSGGLIGITSANCFPSRVRKEWRASWQFNLPGSPWEWVLLKRADQGEGEKQSHSQGLAGQQGNCTFRKDFESKLDLFMLKGQTQNFILDSPSGQFHPCEHWWCRHHQYSGEYLHTTEELAWGPRGGTSSAWRGTGDLFSLFTLV